MDIKNIIVAIDGYSSTGKSTFAKLIASRYGLTYLDSGALYRGVTLFALDAGIIDEKGVIDEPRLKAGLDGLNLNFRIKNGSTSTFDGDRNIERQIRSMRVAEFVSPVAALPFVRAFVDGLLHKFGENGGIVMDGRDIGTTVFPQAQLKIFMTASPRVRARRRYDEMTSKGQVADFQDVMANLLERDRIDSTRAVSPLKKADDALTLDNSDMTLDDQMEWFGERLKEKFNEEV